MTQSGDAGRIGPNAIIRVAEALEAQEGHHALVALFDLAGLAHYLEAPPTTMVDEREVTVLQSALRTQLGLQAARSVSRDAGLRTGDYLLANRIPGPAQFVLSLLPPRLAGRVLIKAIRSNAWTFVGTGVFGADSNYPPRLSVIDSPICRDARADEPLCDFYAGCFERLFRRLVHPEAVATEVACQAAGAEACIFEIRW